MTQTANLKLTLTPDSEASSTTFKTWRNAINGGTNSNMQKIDDFSGIISQKVINNVYTITWDKSSIVLSFDTAKINNFTIKDYANNTISGATFYNQLNTNDNIQVIFKGPAPSSFFNDNPVVNLTVKCVASSICKNIFSSMIQVSAFSGYYNNSYTKAKRNIAIKLNVSATGELQCYIMNFSTSESYENPCLIEGTQITMADNTTKSVEELKPGDVILSYDPVKKQKTNAVVIDAYKTGESRNFDVYSFENGSHLTIYGIHGFYANELGYVKNIQTITKTNELIDENLNTTYLIVKRNMPIRDSFRSRYMIISSNNLYFANGILLGHSPWQKGQYCIKYGVEVPESIKEVYQSEIDSYNGYDSFINTPEYHAEISEQYAKLANAVNEIKIYKDKLTATDYKVQKYTEGVLSEAEWEEAKAKRAAWRQAVNDNEQLRDESRKLVDNIIKKYRKGVTMRQLFEESCTKDNASFETIKNYFDN